MRVKPTNRGGMQVIGANDGVMSDTVHDNANGIAPAPEVPEPQALEAQIQAARQKLIAEDLRVLGAPLPTIADQAYLPSIPGTAEAIGALYVMEGSTLGGQIIKKMIAKQLGTAEDHATSFFNGYGEAT